MELLNLRAIPVVCDKNAYCLNKKELNAIKKIKYRNPDKGFYLSKTTSLLENKALASLKKFIVKKAEEYTRDLLEINDKIYLTQSRCTRNTTNAFHKFHHHPNTFISLVYYAQCESGNIRFDVKSTVLSECFNFEYTINKFNIYNTQNWGFYVKTGDMVLFPGHIRHGSSPNTGKEDRLAVGANFFIKGKLGSSNTVSNITI